jgi:MFS family permease
MREAPWATALRRAVSNAPLVRLQLSWAAVMVGSWTATVSLSVLAYAEGGSSAVALAVLARTVPGALVGPLAGVVVDRLARGTCLVGSALASAAACAGAAVFSGRLAAVIALMTVVGLATMLFRAAQSAVVPQLVEQARDLAAANVLSSAVESLGVFLGPALAAGLLEAQGPQLGLGVAAVLFALAALVLLGLRPPHHAPAAAGRARGGWGELAGLQPVRLLLALVLVQTVVSGGLVVLYPALAVSLPGTGLSAVGYLTAAFGAGGVLASLALFGLAGSRRLGAWSCAALLLWSLPLLLLPLLPQLAPVLVVLAVVGAANVLFDVTSVTQLQRAVPARLLGRVFGALETVVVLGLSVGAVLAPVLDSFAGPGEAVALLATPLALVTLLGTRSMIRLDRELQVPVREVQLLRALPEFAVLAPAELERLALSLQPRAFSATEQVVRQGAEGRTWYLVDRGTLQVSVDDQPVREIGPGASFGEIAVLHGGVRSATVTALGACLLHALDGDVLIAALRADGGRGLAAIDALASERLAAAAPVTSCAAATTPPPRRP